MTKRIPYGRQTIGISEGFSLLGTLYSTHLTQGPRVNEFEEALAEYAGVNYAIAVSSGTAALQLATKAAGFGPKTQTAVPNLTFAATASAVCLAGGKPVLVDIRESSWNIDLESINGFDGNVISVDFAGLPSDVSSGNFQIRPGYSLIEDCAHSLGASTPAGKVGNCSNSLAACFSFHPVKTITAGEGGAVLTNSPDLAETIRVLRSHGIDKRGFTQEWEYDIKDPGQNFRITDLQASVGIRQLKKIDKFIDERNELADRYRELLKNEDLGLPPGAPDGYVHAYHLFPILLKTSKARNWVYSELKNRGIDCQVHYKPLSRLSAFSEYTESPLPVSSSVADRILSMPIYYGLRKHEQSRIVESLKSVVGASHGLD